MHLSEILALSADEIGVVRDFNIKYGKYIQDLSHQGIINFTYTSSRSYTIGNTGIKIGAIKAYPLSVFFNQSVLKKIVAEVFETIDNFIENEDGYTPDQEKHVVDDMVYKAR